VGIGIRYLDLVLLAVALPVFLIASLPMAGYVVLALAWLAQRGVQFAAERQAARSLKQGERRSAVGLIGGSILLRLWIVTLSILLVGLLGDREDGLAAAVLAAILVTVSLASEAITRALEGGEAS
jgi:hypothetical protein